MKLFGRVIVRNKEGKFLVLKNIKEGRNRWEFPGGKMDPEDGNLRVTAKRELREETGLLVAGPLRWVADRDITVDSGDWTGGFYYGRWAETPEEMESLNMAHGSPYVIIYGTPRIVEEGKFADMRWVTVEELNRLPQIPYICVDLARLVIQDELHDPGNHEHPHHNS